jgi:cytochrome c peroxidase|tara:strand:+ start:504 stop:1595 length:1092 start_codon:yes stop_codon:yes gene_type:complete
MKIIFTLFLFLTLIYACKKTILNNPAGEVVVYDPTPYVIDYGTTLSAPNIPTDNPLTEAKVQLGRMLFYSKKLSGDGTMACAGCHKQENAFSDIDQFSTGIQGLKGGRQAMAIVNMAWNTNQFFWDGRANLLRDQSLLPIQDPLEMHETLPNVVSKLKGDTEMKVQFIKAFGSREITTEKISLALEAFMNTLVSGNSKYDQFLAGTATLSASELRGKDLFFDEYNPGFPNLSGADCAHCHSGSNFENDQYMNNGLDLEANIMDNGRMKATMNSADKGKFKVPTLRNVEVTFPYMHDGRFNTLEEVVDHYNNDIRTSNTLDPALQATQSTGLMLTSQDKIDLVNFLKTLTDNSFLTNPAYKDPN